MKTAFSAWPKFTHQMSPPLLRREVSGPRAGEFPPKALTPRTEPKRVLHQLERSMRVPEGPQGGAGRPFPGRAGTAPATWEEGAELGFAPWLQHQGLSGHRCRPTSQKGRSGAGQAELTTLESLQRLASAAGLRKGYGKVIPTCGTRHLHGCPLL